MKIKFLGSGSAFVSTKENYHSNVLITKSGELVNEDGKKENITTNLLIDAGFHIGESLEHFGYKITDIDHIFITHNHGDHNGGLELIGFRTFFDKDAKKPMLFGNTQVLEVLWENVLKGNMQSLNNANKATFLDFFDTRYLKPRSGFQILNTEFYPVRLPHVIDSDDEIPAFGLKWKEDGINFFFSGDTQFDFWRLMPFWEQADIIFQECEFKEYDDSVHCQFRHLKDIPKIYREKMWLYHYMLDGKTFEELNTMVTNFGFKGLIYRGQEFDTVELSDAFNQQSHSQVF